MILILKYFRIHTCLHRFCSTSLKNRENNTIYQNGVLQNILNNFWNFPLIFGNF